MRGRLAQPSCRDPIRNSTRIQEDQSKKRELALAVGNQDTSRRDAEQQVLKCFKCGERGHLERECRKESFKQERAFTVTTAFMVTAEESSSEWILDSGSLIHICNQKKMFTSLQKAEQNEELWGISGKVKVEAYGEVLIRCKLLDGGEGEILLKNVAYVPAARVNILSVSCLTKKGVRLQIGRREILAIFQEQVLLTAKEKQGLYVVQVTRNRNEKQSQLKKKEEVAGAKSNGELEVVHLNVTTQKQKMVTLVDGVSSLSIVQPIEQLSDAEKVIPTLIERLERQSWKKVIKSLLREEWN
jgi:hypothetical protein